MSAQKECGGGKMSSKHEKIVDEVRLYWSAQNRGRLFKNHNGMAFSKVGIPIKYGLQEGSSDLIGWEFIRYELDREFPFEVVVPTIPIICSVEIKTLKYPNFSKKQIAWLNHIAYIGGMAYSVMELKENKEGRIWEIKKWRKK